MLIRYIGHSVQTAILFISCTAASTVVNVSGKASHVIPPLLYGLMFEDINSGDGGLCAEMLQNRAFQQVTPNTPNALYAWSEINGAKINIVADVSPLSQALPNSLQLVFPNDIPGQVGFGNEGYHGIRVNSDWTYNASFYYKFPVSTTFNGVATVALQNNEGHTFASASVPMNGSQTEWKQVAVSLKPTSSPTSTANNFTVTFNETSAAGQTIHFAMFSLFPPTYKDRPNGLRIDLATTLSEMKPSFFRLPGGNNLGQTWETRWKWNETIGSLVDRPGRMGDWGYINTDGLGLLEYMYLCEDLGIEPIMAVWAGYSLNGNSLLEEDLTPHIQSAIDQINFVIGDPATNQFAALRASLGRPKSFALKYVEIGNEDFLASESYVYRWRAFVTSLSTEFPQLRFIATTAPFNPILDPVPTEYDNHLYGTPDEFVARAFQYDTYERNGTYYFQGEYAVTNNNANGQLVYPTVQSSVAEAAFMTGFERNADIVFAASYAPLLMNTAMKPQWTPNLIAFDASNVYPSTSYYVQQLFSTHRGTEYLPSTLPTEKGTLHWSVTRDANLSVVYFKVVNYDTSPAIVTFTLPFEVDSIGQAVVIAGPADASNDPMMPTAIVPMMLNVTLGKTFNYSAPAYSVSALTAFIGKGARSAGMSS